MEKINKELEGMLLTYLGQLMHQRDSAFDWMEKDKIIKKINAVNVLLEINSEEQTAMQKILEFAKTMGNK